MLAGCVAPAAQASALASLLRPVGHSGVRPPDTVTTILAAGLGEPQQDYAGWEAGQ